MAAQSFAYRTHGTAGSDKSCCYQWFVCHDKTTVLARSGWPPEQVVTLLMELAYTIVVIPVFTS